MPKRLTKKILALLLISALLFAFSGCLFDFIPRTPKSDNDNEEIIIIIDASANMLAVQDYIYYNPTRFETAVSHAREQGEKAITDKKAVTLILAGQKAEIIVSKTDSTNLFNSALNPLECTYGMGDIDGALQLAGYSKNNKQNDHIFLYTATKYADAGGINIIDVSDNEWNAAILNVVPILEEGYYKFEVTVASYNKDTDLTVHISIEGTHYWQTEPYQPNQSDPSCLSIASQKNISCIYNEPVTVYFDDLQIYSYSTVLVEIIVYDSFAHDNQFYLYGGVREEINVLYISTAHNAFINGILDNIRNVFSQRQNIIITQAKLGEIDLTGYDFYIFEHEMPQTLPTDGAVLLINPDIAPQNSGLILGDKVSIADGNFPLTAEGGQPNVIMDMVRTDDMHVYEYTTVVSSADYRWLIFTQSGDPVFLVKDTADAKIAVLSFALQDSNMPLLMDFSILTHNLYNCFIPSALTKYVYEVGEEITVNGRGSDLLVDGPESSDLYNSFPFTFSASTAGVYTLRQTLWSAKVTTEYLFVKIPASQSNFCRIESLS